MSEDDYEKMKDLFATAFPDGDFKGHHDFHKRLVEKAEEDKRVAAEKAEDQKQIKLEVKKKVVSGIVWAVIFVILSVAAEKLFGVRLS